MSKVSAASSMLSTAEHRLWQPVRHPPPQLDLNFSPSQLFFLNNTTWQFWAHQQKKNTGVDIIRAEVLAEITYNKTLFITKLRFVKVLRQQDIYDDLSLNR